MNNEKRGGERIRGSEPKNKRVKTSDVKISVSAFFLRCGSLRVLKKGGKKKGGMKKQEE